MKKNLCAFLVMFIMLILLVPYSSSGMIEDGEKMVRGGRIMVEKGRNLQKGTMTDNKTIVEEGEK